MPEAGEIEELSALEQALRAAARRYVRDLRDSERAARTAGECRALFARLGLDAAEADRLAAPEGWRSLDPSTRTAMLAALDRDKEKLNRLARSGQPAYDINRHIAVRRALAILGRPAIPSAPDAREARLSGRTPNRRFSRPRVRPHRPETNGGAAKAGTVPHGSPASHLQSLRI